MGFIEQMKWWHWTLISLALGALLAYVNSGGADTSVNHESLSTLSFETALLLRPWTDPKDPNHREPWFSDIVVHPVQDIPVGDHTVKMQLVSFTRLIAPDQAHPSGSTETQYCWAPFPYEPTPRANARPSSAGYPGTSLYIGKKGDTLESLAARFYHKSTPQGIHAIIYANGTLREAHGPSQIKIQAGRAYWIPWNPDDHHTISDFLLATNNFIQKQQGPSAMLVSFHYRWWENSRYTYEAWIIGSFLIIGVIWPTLLSVMLKGGYGRLTPDEFNLSRYKPAPATAGKPAAATVTQSDMDRLRDLEESLTASIKSGAAETPAPTPSPAVAATAAPAVKKLTAAPDQAPKAAPQAPEEPTEYMGEFYPVVKPHEKPKDTK